MNERRRTSGEQMSLSLSLSLLSSLQPPLAGHA
jgi:hypothetical protein